MAERPFTILCLATEHKGVPFIQQCKAEGGHILLISSDKAADADWPWDSIDEHFHMSNLSQQPDITHGVSYLVRGRRVDRIVALDDYDVGAAAALREHLRLPGIGETIARHFRDKLAMRQTARDAGILVPEFTALFNYDILRDFMNRVPTPWVLKPRFEAGAVGIRKMHHSEEVWRALDELGDKQSFYLLEQFVPGDVYHVDSLVWDREPVFALASVYGLPPMAVSQGGGIFTTRTLDRESDESKTLLSKNRELLQALGLKQGVSHTEFIRGEDDGRFYFLETAARVGGANIDRMVEAATGVTLWAEAARIEIADIRGQTYRLPDHRQEHAGLLTCLSRQEHPDLSAYQDPEIVWRLPKRYHAGLLVAAPTAQRVADLLIEYNQRFRHDFLAVQPPKTDVRTTL